MQKKSSIKSIIIFVGIIVLAILGYFYFSGSPKDSASQLTSSGTPSPATVVATRVLTLLNQTSSLHIDPALFKSAIYKSLVDHTVPVVEQPVGKANPFLYTVSSPAPASSPSPAKPK